MSESGLPIWLTVVVVLTLLGLMVYNLAKFGPEGYPSTIVYGGLLGGYAGLNELIKRNGGEKK